MSVIRFNFFSQTLAQQVNVTVCLPTYSLKDAAAGVDADQYYRPGMKYQTLWLLHGGGGDDSDYVINSNIVRYSDEHKVAVVCPADYNQYYANDIRGGGKYFDYIVDELPRVLRGLFPLSPAREDNFIGGLSMGGCGAFKCAIARPDLYGSALIMSGGILSKSWLESRYETGRNYILFSRLGTPDEFENGPDDMWSLARKRAQEGTEMPKFYLSVGSEDFTRQVMRDSCAYIRDLGFNVAVYEEVAGFHHEWPLWDRTLQIALTSWLPVRNAPVYL